MADKKRTILLPKQSSTIGSLSPINLLRKTGQIISQTVKTERHGLEGKIATFEKPAVTIDWELAYKRGAGKSLRSKILEGRTFSLPGKGEFRRITRSKRGPRFNIKVKF